jgi:hypothetical protein
MRFHNVLRAVVQAKSRGILVTAPFLLWSSSAAVAQPSRTEDEFAIRSGEILLQGHILEADPDKKSLVLEVALFTLSSSKTSKLSSPKPKVVLLNDRTLLHVRGDEKRTVALAELKQGIFAVAIGPDTGSGKELTARQIAVWDSVHEGTFQFHQKTSPPEQTAPTEKLLQTENPTSAQLVSPAATPALRTMAPGSAGIATGWPVIVPGSVTGAPTPADLDGDGKLEIVVPCEYRPSYSYSKTVAHPQPDLAGQVFAFHLDGTPVPGWPVVLMKTEERRAYREGMLAAKRGGVIDNWSSSPSVLDLDRNGADEIVIAAPSGGSPKINVLWGDGTPWPWLISEASADPWASVPLVDMNNDGEADLIIGNLPYTITNKLVPGWSREYSMSNSYSTCVGDADGDGDLEIYCTHKAMKTFRGFDSQGEELPGWPQPVGTLILYPVMGNVTGDDKMEVCGVDQDGQIHLWTWDGKPLPSTRAIGEYSSVFKTGYSSGHTGWTPPTLADLDGDGKAEIIVFDEGKRTLRGWHGDGRGVIGDKEDGTIVRLSNARCWGGVTVADLGGDGEMDLFVGTYWIRLARDGQVSVTEMFPGPAPSTTHCSITDLEHDGVADILFGLTDGQVFVYNTGKAYKAEWMQWETAHGNFRRTGAWQLPQARLR